jgi:PPOX class probable F420-dependent enzyme
MEQAGGNTGEVPYEAGSLGSLIGHKYCELVSFRHGGAAVPTPVWFALDGDRLLVKTENPSGKVRRIRRDSRVQVAPCTLRGRRLAAPIEARARVLERAEQPAAERVLRERYGFGRRLFGLLVEPIFRWRGLTSVYLEVVAAEGRR